METVKEKSDVQAMMEAYNKLATPGPQHKLLSKMEGSWITKNRYWMDPDQPPMQSTGTSENKMIYDGRFLHQEYTDTMMGSPVKGMVISGYDNGIKKYVTASLGTIGTSIMLLEGEDSADGKTFIQSAKYNDPIQGPTDYRSVIKLIDDNTYTFELYASGKSGNEMKMMETTYIRKK
jgi:hypothetical protein